MVDDMLLKKNASHGAAVLAACTVLQKPRNIVHRGTIEFVIHHGSHVTGGQSDCLHTSQILGGYMMNNPIADLQRNSKVRCQREIKKQWLIC